MQGVLGIAGATFVVTAVIMPLVIPLLRKLKFGQSIREIGPSWHQSKTGTPTMGGIAFIITILVLFLIMAPKNPATMLLILGSLSFGIIGFLDDFIKIALKRNLGLRAWQKMALQIIAAVAFVFVGLQLNVIDRQIYIPFTDILLDLGIFYIPIVIFIILGVVNSVNLTDGVDGLASSVTAVVMIFYTIIMYRMNNSEGMLYASAVFGGLLGFLLFNRHPAKVFMGDTGSLFLGGAVVSLAILAKNPLMLAILGIIYLVETASVIIQVFVFKLTKKRVFKMSPIHHHFEMSKWSENKIVRVFTIITALASVIAFVSMMKIF